MCQCDCDQPRFVSYHDLRGSVEQLPLFLSEPTKRAIRWAAQIPPRIWGGERYERQAGTFSPRELYDFLGDRDLGERVIDELQRSAMLRDEGYFRHGLKIDKAACVVDLEDEVIW